MVNRFVIGTSISFDRMLQPSCLLFSVTGERQSLVGRIRDRILRGRRNLNPLVLLGGRSQEIQ